MTKLKLAISHYDRFVPLLEGVEAPEGFDLDVLHVSQSNYGRYGQNRHERMLRHREFDIAEVSLSSYIMERTRSKDFTAIPVFPRRLFSQSQIWVHATGKVKKPEDLIGKRVGLNTFQTTLSVLAKGDLQSVYGVPWRSIEWVVSKEETIPFEKAAGVSITTAPAHTNIGEMLMRGEIDAIFRPHPPRRALEGDSEIKRLFADPKGEEARYFKQRGFYPIMHVMAFRTEVLERYPNVRQSVMDMFQRIEATTARYYDDPNWSRLAWGRLHLEEERNLLGPNLWPIGIEENRKNMEQFIAYSHDQGLLPRKVSVDELF